jgi:hypothetical protein
MDAIFTEAFWRRTLGKDGIRSGGPPRLAQRLPANQRAPEREERLVNVGPLVIPHSQALRVDQATEVISPTPIDASTGRGLIPNLGSLVQVHFSESRGERVAALVVAEGAQLPLTPVKDLEQSVLGEAKRFKSRTVVVGIDGHTRDVSLNDDTQLVDRNGSVRAVGTKAIKAALVAGTKVLVTWKPFWVTDGSGAVTGYYLDAETIRMITVSPLDEKNALTVR